MSTSKISTITKLMKQADDATKLGNTHEAELFYAKANKMAQDMHMEESDIRSHMNEEEKKDTMVIDRVPVGRAGIVGLKNRCQNIAYITGLLLNVQVDMRADGSELIFFGSGQSVSEAKELTRVLLEQNNHGIPFAKKMAKHDGERFSRLHYDFGFFDSMSSLAEDMKESREKYITDNLPDESVAPESLTAAQSQALALRNMELEVQDFYNMNSNARGTMKRSYSYTQGDSSMNAGRQVGKNSTLSSQRALTA